MFWIVAIGIGLLVGFGVTKAAGKGGAIVQALCVVATLVSVLLGELIFIGYNLHVQAGQDNSSIDWGKFVLAVPEILIGTGRDTLFALGGGLLGACYAVRMAGKPKIDVKVEG